MSQKPTIGWLVEQTARALEPLAAQLSSPESALDLLEDLGFRLEEAPQPLLDLAGPLSALIQSVDELNEALASGDTLRILQAVTSASIASANATAEVASLGARLEAALASASIDTADASRLGKRLLDRLTFDYLSSSNPALLYGLSVFGIVEVDYQPATSVGTVGHSRVNMYPDRIGAWIRNPLGQMSDIYGWGAPGFDPLSIQQQLAALLRALEVMATLHRNDGSAELRMPIYQDAGQLGAMELGLVLLPLAGGVGVAPYAEGDVGWSADLTDEVKLTLSGDLDHGGGLILAVRPPARFKLETRSGTAPGGLTLGIEVSWIPGVRPVVLAHPSLFELSFGELKLALDAGYDDGEVVPAVTATLQDCIFELGFGEADGFLRSALPGQDLRAEFDLGLRWSRSNLTFSGSSGLDVGIPLHITIGALTVEELHVTLAIPGDGSATLTATVTASFGLGPLLVQADSLGAGLAWNLVEQGGNLGWLQIGTPAFVPPHGLGIAIEAGVGRGGGYLFLDPEAGEYAGVVDLDLLTARITSVGIIHTKLPGGDWSMFLSLSARFVGVQLGFGFTLNGVGGLVGVHRGLDEDALGDAVRTGSLDAILFCEDPVADAMRILAEIDAIFPPVQDQYVFGPVVKIGWGTPTLIEIDIGIAIQLPEPLTISLLGALEAVLPDEAAPILELNAAFAGTLNVTEGTLKIDASLSGSKVAGFLITGDMSVRMEFYGQPSFLVAFGGFHPAFDPPASFPKLERLAISLDTGDTLQLALGGYFALTSNSIQFGAFAYFHISEAGFTAEGGTNFDALIIYRQFGFTIGLSVWVSISAGKAELLCVQLSGDLTGPNPWQLVAEASFKILGIKQSIDLELSFGDRESQAAVEEVDVQTLLEEELARDDAWSVLSPAGDAPVIASSTTDVPALDPAGRVQVGQRIVPLDRAIERYGNADLAGEDTFSVEVEGFAADEIEDLEDWFGSEHYFRLDQDERLSAPSFTLMKAGVIVGGSTAAAPPVRSMTYDHEIAYKDPSAETPRRSVAIAGEATLDRALAMRSVSAPRRQYAIHDASYALCDATTGRVVGGPGPGGDFFAARTALAMTARDHALVIPAYELDLLA